MPSPSQRLDLLSKRIFQLATSTANPIKDNVDARSLYVGFRGLIQISSSFNNHNNNNNNDNNNNQNQINFSILFNLFQRCAKTMPVKHIPPCLFVLTHSRHHQQQQQNYYNYRNNNNNNNNGNNNFSVTSAEWEVHQTRLAISGDGSVVRELSPDDASSLLHSLATHGKLCPVLTPLLFERVAQTISQLQVSQLCSVFYSLAILGVSGKSGSSFANSTSTTSSNNIHHNNNNNQQEQEHHATEHLLLQLKTELQRNKAQLLSMQDLARIIPKVGNSVSLGFKVKVELIEPLLPRIANLMNEISLSNNNNNNNNNQQRYSSSNLMLLKESTVIFLSLAKLRRMKSSAYESVLNHLVRNSSLLTSRQKVVVLFGLFSAGEFPNSNNNNNNNSDIKKWYVRTATFDVCKSENEIRQELTSKRWDHVTLSYFVTSLSFAHDLNVASNNNNNNKAYLNNSNETEQLQKLKSDATRICDEYKIDRRQYSSSNQQSHSPTSSFSDNNSSKYGNAAKIHNVVAMTERGESFSNNNNNTNINMNSVQRLHAFNNFAMSSFSSNNNRREIEQNLQQAIKNIHFAAVPTNTIVAYLKTLGRLRMSATSSSHQNNNNNICDPYEPALAVIFGEPITARKDSSFTHKGVVVAPRHPDDLSDDNGPRNLFPSEAATIMAVLARISLRRAYLTLRLCNVLLLSSSKQSTTLNSNSSADELSVSLRSLALHSLSELRFPHRNCIESLTGILIHNHNNNISDEENKSSLQNNNNNNQNLSLSAIIQKYNNKTAALAKMMMITENDKNNMNNNNNLPVVDDEMIINENQQDSTSSSSFISSSTCTPLHLEIHSKGTVVNAVHCLIGCGFSDNVARYQKLTNVCFERLLDYHFPKNINNLNSNSRGKALISRSLKLQLPLSICQLGGNKKNNLLLEKSVEDFIFFFTPQQYRQTFLGENWYVILFWKQGVAPFLHPDLAEKYDKIISEYVKNKLQMVLQNNNNNNNNQNQNQQQPKLSMNYQLACGLETKSFPLSSSSSLSLQKMEEISSFLSRMKFSQVELQRNTELILPACLCLSKILEEILETLASSSSSSSLLNNNNDNHHQIFSYVTELHAVLESNCLRFVSRSDDLALMLFSMRNLLQKAADFIIFISDHNNNNNNNIVENNEEKKEINFSLDDENSPITIALSNSLPLCRSIVSALYIRETAPGIGSMSTFRSNHHDNNHNNNNNSNSTNNENSTMTVPTSQLTCVGLRLLCKSIEEGILFQNGGGGGGVEESSSSSSSSSYSGSEEETFEIALSIIILAVPRLSNLLSAFDAATCLKSLMNIVSIRQQQQQHYQSSKNNSGGSSSKLSIGIFSTMDILSRIVRKARTKNDSIASHHQSLCLSVLPGLGELGQESSVLSL